MHKTDTTDRYGGTFWAHALVSPRMSLNTFPNPYAILKNIIRSKYDASARHHVVQAISYTESTVTLGVGMPTRSRNTKREVLVTTL